MLKNKIITLIKGLYRKDKKLFILITVGIAAVIMIIVSEPKQNKGAQTDVKPNAVSEAEYEKTLEKRLTDIISKIDGAGRTEVMIKTRSAGKEEYLKNKKSEALSDGGQRDEYEYVITDSGTKEECVLIKSEYPEIEGVIVVCQGGDNSVVKNNVTNAVAGLLGISTYNISVLRMKQTEG